MTPPFIRSLSLVALGGAAGAAVREGLVLGLPGAGRLPWAIIVANIAGAFLLGLLYAGLDQREAYGSQAGSAGQAEAVSAGAGGGSVRARNRRLRLLLGTGFCGGFTTYSTLAVGAVLLAGSAGAVWAGAYAAGTVVMGALATWAGIALGTGALAGHEHRPAPRGGRQP